MLPPTGSASGDDLQDLLSLYLDQCKTAGGELYAFGAKFEQNLHKPIDAEFGNTDGLHGIHDIHLNQGNVGQHAGDNGVFHDGGLILAFPDRFLGLFLGFQTPAHPDRRRRQCRAGRRHHRPDPRGRTRRASPPTGRSLGTVYIERALINPSGADPGREIVVLASLSTTAQTLTNWRLLDKNGRVTPINVTIGPGQSALVTLDGNGVQLGNNGGNADAAGQPERPGRRRHLHGRGRGQPMIASSASATDGRHRSGRESRRRGILTGARDPWQRHRTFTLCSRLCGMIPPWT